LSSSMTECNLEISKTFAFTHFCFASKPRRTAETRSICARVHEREGIRAG
jgi:ligand-binding sensor protein